jgi:anti-sigma B factor antagonist
MGDPAEGQGAVAAFRVDRLAGCVLVTATGEIDSETTPGLHDALQTAVATGSRLIIDLTAVTFIGTPGLGVLLVVRNQASETGNMVSLVGVPPRVRRLLAQTQIDRAFSVFDRLEQAVAAFTQPDPDSGE